MPTPTYDLIEEQVLSSAQTSVTFSSIPGTYKDLVLEIIFGQDTGDDVGMQFNGDTANNYSSTWMMGSASTSLTGRYSSSPAIYPRIYAGPGTTPASIWIENILSYANTNVYKTSLGRMTLTAPAMETEAHVGLWRSTSAITSIRLYNLSGTWKFVSGSTFRIWGVGTA